MPCQIVAKTCHLPRCRSALLTQHTAIGAENGCLHELWCNASPSVVPPRLLRIKLLSHREHKVLKSGSHRVFVAQSCGWALEAERAEKRWQDLSIVTRASSSSA